MIHPDVNPIDLEAWSLRWSSVEQHLNYLREGLDGANTNVSRKKILLHLVDRLLLFGRKQFNYFHKLIPEDTFDPTFIDTHHDNKRVTLSNEYILRQIIQRVATDARVLMQAIEQRVFYEDHAVVRNTAIEPMTIIEALEQADKIAYASIQPAVDSGILEGDWTALTYFMRDPQVRVIPYAKVVLVGVPITCVRQPRDFLAIPHEVGHYVYWNAYEKLTDEHREGKPRRKIWRAIEHDLKNLPPDDKGRERIWLKKWAEEVFADAYGVLVGGPAIALSFQQLAEETDDDQFEEDDGHHPTPMLRAHLYFRVLKVRGGTVTQNATRRLVKRWHRAMKRRKKARADAPMDIDRTNSKPLETITDEWLTFLNSRLRFDVWNVEERLDPDENIKVTSEEITAGLSEIVDTILKYLPTLKASGDLISNLRAYNPIDAQGKELTGIGATLQAVAVEVDRETASKFDQVPAINQSWEAWAANLHSQIGVVYSEDEEQMRKNLAPKWLAILRGDGWTTVGPHGRPNDTQ